MAEIKEMKRKKLKTKNLMAFPEFLPAIAGIIIIPFLKGNEALILMLIAVVLLVSFKMRYYKHEWLFFFAGVAAGSFIEFVGDAVYKLQYWEQASLFGLPLWLPFFWGFSFVFIRRLGNLIVKEK